MSTSTSAPSASAVTPTVTVSTPASASPAVSASEIRGIVREVLGELLPAMVGSSHGSGLSGPPSSGASGGEC